MGLKDTYYGMTAEIARFFGFNPFSRTLGSVIADEKNYTGLKSIIFNDGYPNPDVLRVFLKRSTGDDAIFKMISRYRTTEGLPDWVAHKAIGGVVLDELFFNNDPDAARELGTAACTSPACGYANKHRQDPTYPKVIDVIAKTASLTRDVQSVRSMVHKLPEYNSESLQAIHRMFTSNPGFEFDGYGKSNFSYHLAQGRMAIDLIIGTVEEFKDDAPAVLHAMQMIVGRTRRYDMMKTTHERATHFNKEGSLAPAMEYIAKATVYSFNAQDVSVFQKILDTRNIADHLQVNQ